MRQVVEFGDRSTEKGTFGPNLGRAIVTNGDFTAYVCDNAATRLSSQITLGRLVVTRYNRHRPTLKNIVLYLNRNNFVAFLAKFGFDKLLGL